ncbi:hypothetical protein V2J09_009930 [Rumex salicifolius]
MELFRSQRKPSAAIDIVSSLPLYRSPPSLEVRLEDFELFAIDRLRVLRGIWDGSSRGKKTDEMEKLVEDLWKAHMRRPHLSESIEKDVISHFVLRLVYCRTEDLRKWFLSVETTLFRHRFNLESFEARRSLLAEFDLPYKAVGSAEYESVKEKLTQVARFLGQSAASGDNLFYKVPFEEVPELVAGRKVYLNKGHAYVPMHQAYLILLLHLLAGLSGCYTISKSSFKGSHPHKQKYYQRCLYESLDLFGLQNLDGDTFYIVEALNTSYLGPDFSQPKEHFDISLSDIDRIAHSSFPLCMSHLFEKLKEDHHLKYGGRMQLGLFLKGVGLKLEDALIFWKAEFSKNVGPERFDKEYAYNIRHYYGKEGKRSECSPYSCQKVISSTSVGGGCPYRQFSEDNLRAALGKLAINSRAVEEVLEKVKNRHYQLACTMVFETVHGQSCDGINHPNQYFVESQKILQKKVASNTGSCGQVKHPASDP